MCHEQSERLDSRPTSKHSNTVLGDSRAETGFKKMRPHHGDDKNILLNKKTQRNKKSKQNVRAQNETKSVDEKWTRIKKAKRKIKAGR